MRSCYGQKSFLVAVQFGKGHICFTKPFLLKLGCEISFWRFLKFWFFYTCFYCKSASVKKQTKYFPFAPIGAPGIFFGIPLIKFSGELKK